MEFPVGGCAPKEKAPLFIRSKGSFQNNDTQQGLHLIASGAKLRVAFADHCSDYCSEVCQNHK
jgi:hypothetical protein